MMSSDKNFLVSHLENLGVLRTLVISQAFQKIDRRDFVPEEVSPMAYENIALPIGYGQTISEPMVVALMLELLEAKTGEKILDVGSGSGWTTALLADIVGGKGRVYGVEIIPELVEFGRKNLERYKFPWASISRAGKVLGLFQEAPFDKILVSAAASKFPEELWDQLQESGIIVIPIGNTIQKIKKLPGGGRKTETLEGFAFVPLIEK